jgi:hypothetical protein
VIDIDRVGFHPSQVVKKPGLDPPQIAAAPARVWTFEKFSRIAGCSVPADFSAAGDRKDRLSIFRGALGVSGLARPEMLVIERSDVVHRKPLPRKAPAVH